MQSSKSTDSFYDVLLTWSTMKAVSYCKGATYEQVAGLLGLHVAITASCLPLVV